jgi:hypothetical protein
MGRKKSVDVAVIIPDASPILTLARVRRLDLLERFDVPVHIVDQVHYEVTRPENDIDGEVGRYLLRQHNMITIVGTATGSGFKAQRQVDPSFPSRNLGEQAVDEHVRRLVSTSGPSFVPMVLFEDPDVLVMRMAQNKRIHLMNTTAWLIGMYEIGALPEGPDLVAAIDALRKTPMQPLEKGARTKKILSAWKRKIER